MVLQSDWSINEKIYYYNNIYNRYVDIINNKQQTIIYVQLPMSTCYNFDS